MSDNNKKGHKPKKLKCDYCTQTMPVDEITDGWIQATARDGKVVLTGCPDHSAMVINVVNEINSRHDNDMCKCGHARKKHGKINRMCYAPGCKCMIFRTE